MVPSRVCALRRARPKLFGLLLGWYADLPCPDSVCCKNTDCGRQPFCLSLLWLFHIGRALCYLIHFYHPTQLPLSAIRTVTTKAPAPAPVEDDVPDENVVKGRVVRAVALTFSPGAANSEAALRHPVTLPANEPGCVRFTGNRPGVLTAEKVAQNNERANFREVQRAVAAMGGVPFHRTSSPPADLTNPTERLTGSPGDDGRAFPQWRLATSRVECQTKSR